MKLRNPRLTWALAMTISVVAVAAACGGGDSRSREAIRGRVKKNADAAAGAGAETTGNPKKIDPANAGTISGVVKWEGAKPSMETIDMSGTPDCARVVKETLAYEHIVVNDDNTVRFAFVSIDTADVYDAPSEAAVIDQVGCRYVPHVFAVMSGQKLKIKSSDSTGHNVHYMPFGDVNEEENFAMTTAGTRERTFTSNDWIKFKCDLHPWMGAWCAVRTHPFFAVTGADGKFTIANVPAGTHKLVLKHEVLGEQSVTVTVEAGKTATTEFTLKK